MESYQLRNNNAAELVAATLNIFKAPGAVALLPTETVYGLFCRWEDQAAIQRIYEMKGRHQNKPLAMFAASVNMVERAGVVVKSTARQLIDAFCPGPLTLVIPGTDNGTVGFRIPDHPFMLKLLKHGGFPLASTSANRSGAANALTVEEALAELHTSPDLAIDAGIIPLGNLASTVVKVDNNGFIILRPGPITESEIALALRDTVSTS